MIMEQDTLASLETAHEGLIEALDANDIDAIEQRVDELRAAIAHVRSQGAWRECPRLKERAQRIVKLGEAARLRVNFLTDMNRRRIQTLTAARGEPAAAVYARRGRTAA